MYLCYFDGFFPKAPPLPVAGTPYAPFDRIAVYVASSIDELDFAGDRGRVPLIAPR